MVDSPAGEAVGDDGCTGDACAIVGQVIVSAVSAKSTAGAGQAVGDVVEAE